MPSAHTARDYDDRFQRRARAAAMLGAEAGVLRHSRAAMPREYRSARCRRGRGLLSPSSVGFGLIGADDIILTRAGDIYKALSRYRCLHESAISPYWQDARRLPLRQSIINACSPLFSTQRLFIISRRSAGRVGASGDIMPTASATGRRHRRLRSV